MQFEQSCVAVLLIDANNLHKYFQCSKFNADNKFTLQDKIFYQKKLMMILMLLLYYCYG